MMMKLFACVFFEPIIRIDKHYPISLSYPDTLIPGKRHTVIFLMNWLYSIISLGMTIQNIRCLLFASIINQKNLNIRKRLSF